MSNGDHLTADRGAIRFLLLALGVPQALIGLWALLGPHSFYADFPAGTDGWVHVLGPFDEHLVTDVGALFVALGVVMAFAAMSLRRGTVVAAATGWLVFSVPHFLWHVFNLDPYTTADAVANTVTLGWTVAGGVLVLFLALRRRERRPAPAGAAADGARIAPVSDTRAGLLARAAYRYSRRDYGAVAEPLRVFAHHPRVLSGYAGLEYATAKADRVPHRLKALAATKAAALAGCEFCMDIGSMISGSAGVSEEQLRALPQHSTSELFSVEEKLVLDLAVGMSQHPCGRVRRAVRPVARALRRSPARGAGQRDRRGELPRTLRLGLRDRLPGLHRGRFLRAAGGVAAGGRRGGPRLDRLTPARAPRSVRRRPYGAPSPDPVGTLRVPPLISREEALSLGEIEDRAEIERLVERAWRVRQERFGDSTDMCSLVNAKSGGCAEDCGFCAQSRFAEADTPMHAMMTAEQILEHARAAEAAGAHRFCMVTQGQGLSKRDFENVLEGARLVAQHTNLKRCASIGHMSSDRAHALKDAGIQRVHHNVETAESYYPEVSSTVRYEGRIRTIDAVRDAGLETCVGGILNLGESREQRVEMAFQLAALEPTSVPINLLNPRPGTKFGDRELMDPMEVVQWVAIFRLVIPDALFRLCGGRNENLGTADLQQLAVKAGLNGVMMGNFLTTLGSEPEWDRAVFEGLGLNVARQEDNGANPRPDNRSGWLEGESPQTPIDELVDSQAEANFWDPATQLRHRPKRSVPPRPDGAANRGRDPNEQPTEELPALVLVDPKAAA